MEQAFKNTIVTNVSNVNGIVSVITDCKHHYQSWSVRATDNEPIGSVSTLST
jgi:hypothetical protein